MTELGGAREPLSLRMESVSKELQELMVNRPNLIIEVGSSAGGAILQLLNEFKSRQFKDSVYVPIDPHTVPPKFSGNFTLPIKVAVGRENLSFLNRKAGEVWMKNIASIIGKPHIMKAIYEFLKPGASLTIVDTYTFGIEDEIPKIKEIYADLFDIEEIDKGESIFVKKTIRNKTPNLLLRLTKK